MTIKIVDRKQRVSRALYGVAVQVNNMQAGIEDLRTVFK